MCADPRGFSQLITSFIASESLGIPHTPLLTFFYDLTRKFMCLDIFTLLFHYVKERLLKHLSSSGRESGYDFFGAAGVLTVVVLKPFSL